MRLPVTLGLAIALAIASALWASAADPPEQQLRGLIPKIVRAWESMNIGTVDAGPPGTAPRLGSDEPERELHEEEHGEVDDRGTAVFRRPAGRHDRVAEGPSLRTRDDGSTIASREEQRGARQGLGPHGPPSKKGGSQGTSRALKGRRRRLCDG